MKNMIKMASLLTCAALPVAAADWHAGQDKGLQVYTLQDGPTQLLLVCDPDEVWSPPSYSVTPSRAGATLDGTTVKVTTAEKSLTLPLSGGSILGNDKAEWNDLLSILTHPGNVSFSASGGEFSITVSSGAATTCAR